jgi:hypothetical protein
MIPILLLPLAAGEGDGAGSITITLSKPSEGEKVSGEFALEGHAMATAPVAAIEYSVVVRGEPPSRWDVVPDSSVEKVGGDPAHVKFAHKLRSRALPNGEFTLAVRALDSSVPQKVSAPALANVTVENTPPVVVLEAPAGPLGGKAAVSGSVEAETLERVESVLVLLKESPHVSAPGKVDPATGRFTAELDLSPLADGKYTLIAQVTYDGGARANSPDVALEVRNPLTLQSIAFLVLIVALAAVALASAGGRVVANRRLRSAGLDPKDVVREPVGQVFRRLAARNAPLYGVAKHEGGGRSESVHTLDAVALEKGENGWRAWIRGKLTWRRSGIASGATVFHVDEWSGRVRLGDRLVALTRKHMRRSGLAEIRFEIMGEGETEEARAQTLLASGAKLESESAGRSGRVRVLTLRK